MKSFLAFGKFLNIYYKRLLTMKNCNECKLEKKETEFHKCTANKDGLQNKCKVCANKNSKDFRLKNTEYYFGNSNSYFVKNSESYRKYNKEYYGANKPAKIYCIELPEGIYIGVTKRFLHTRLTQHVNDYKKVKRVGVEWHNGHIPLLHMELDKYSIEEATKFIKNGYVLEEFEATQYEMKKKELEWIQKLTNSDKKLLNYQGNSKINKKDLVELKNSSTFVYHYFKKE